MGWAFEVVWYDPMWLSNLSFHFSYLLKLPQSSSLKSVISWCTQLRSETGNLFKLKVVIRYNNVSCWSCRAVVAMDSCVIVQGLRCTSVMERLLFRLDLNEKVSPQVTGYLFWSFPYLKGLVLCSFSGSYYHFWVSTRTLVSKTLFFYHISLCSSTSIHPLSECFVSVPVSLRPPSWKAQTPVIGQLSQAWVGTPPSCFCVSFV